MGLTRDKNRELDERWIAEILSWIEETGEVFVYLRYLFNSPNMKFALATSEHALRRLVQIYPQGAELTACKGEWLPIRGVVGAELLARVQDGLPARKDCVCVFTQGSSPEHPVLKGDSWCSVSEMVAELREHEGEQVAIGVFAAGERKTISAVIGGLDGPR
jgi:hypothetical protein